MSGQGIFERCARAAHETAREPVKNLWPSYEDDTPENRTRSRQIVRAVLAELREPTDEMLDVATMADVPWEYEDTATGDRVCGPFALELSGPCKLERAKEVSRALFAAMIDAALSDRPADGGGG